MTTRVAAICLFVSICGCVQFPLKRNFIKQSTTLAEIEYQQVLDNLAKFSANPGALPHFALPGSGTTQIGGSANGGMLFNYNRLGFTGWNFNFGGSASEQANWVLAPVNDPNRLKRMRCAFQVATGTFPLPSEWVCDDDCYECEKVFKAMGLLKAKACSEASGEYGVTETVEGSKIAELCDCEPQSEAYVASLDCNFPTGWFCVGSRHDVPCDACYVGSHCGTYAWVTPRGMDEFSRFTLTILTLATTDPPGPNAEVERTLDTKGVVTGIKVKTRENVTVEEIPGQPGTTDDEQPLGWRVESSGPISEPRTYVPSDSLQGIIQLQAPPP